MGYKYKYDEIMVDPDSVKEPIHARDNVSHYTTGKVETIDYITDKLGPDGSIFFVLGNIIKYASRAMHKGQLRSDLEKIRNYATIALEILDEHETTTKE